MNDYKELIGQLNGACCFKMVDGDISKADLFARAADAIEQLVKERDAAVADLELVCNSVADSTEMCDVCKKDGASSCYAGVCAWEWRGVQEEEHEID